MTDPDAPAPPPLSRRERELMDVIYRLGPSTVADVRDGMADPPSYSSVRTLLGVLVDKGHLVTDRAGTAYVYRPTVPADVAGRRALGRLVRTFFGGSIESAVSTLLADDDVDPATLDQLAELVDRARKPRP